MEKQKEIKDILSMAINYGYLEWSEYVGRI